MLYRKNFLFVLRYTQNNKQTVAKVQDFEPQNCLYMQQS